MNRLDSILVRATVVLALCTALLLNLVHAREVNVTTVALLAPVSADGHQPMSRVLGHRALEIARHEADDSVKLSFAGTLFVLSPVLLGWLFWASVQRWRPWVLRTGALLASVAYVALMAMMLGSLNHSASAGPETVGAEFARPDRHATPASGDTAAPEKRFLKFPTPHLDFKTLDGRMWTYDPAASDKVLLVDFWATWCAPCVASIPRLQALADEFKGEKDFTLVMVSLDDNVDVAREYARAHPLPGVQLTTGGTAWKHPAVSAFRVASIPHTEIVSRAGTSQPIELSEGRPADVIRAVLATARSEYK